MQASKVLIMVGILLAGSVRGEDLILRSVEHLTGNAAGLETWSFGRGRATVETYDGSDAPTIAQAVANTNSAEFATWLALRPDVLTAAEVASLELDLVATVSSVFGVSPPYSANVVDNHRALLRTQMKAQRVIANDAGNTDAERLAAHAAIAGRQEIINLVREIERQDPSWSIGDVE